MLSLLSNWKLYLLSFALIGALLWNVLLKYQNEKLEGANFVCQADKAVMQNVIAAAQEMSKQHEAQQRLREQEAAKARAESLKRKDEIMGAEIKGGCEGAIQWMIDSSSDLH